MDYSSLLKLCEKIACEAKKDAPMSRYTSFRIGGPADVLLFVNDEVSLKAVLEKITEENLPFFALGRGTNLLVSDEGYRGVVLRLGGDFKKNFLKDEETLVCGCGASLASACAFAKRNSLSGLEFAWGIPGTCGGAICMNAGAYGGEMKGVTVLSTHMTSGGKIETFSKEDLKFSYRKSAYSGSGLVILKAELKLKKGDKEEIKAKMKDLITKRKNKQPLNFPSAGSIFKRPEGYYAGTLIQECGLKGESVGGASVSEKHAGFIINKGGATCQDVVDLIHRIQNKILQKAGVEMKTEIKTLGNVEI